MLCRVAAVQSLPALIYSLSIVYRVTDEALIAETAVWHNFFLMNVFFARKGYKHFIIISRVETKTFSRASPLMCNTSMG